MPIPLIPAVVIGTSSLVTGLILGGDRATVSVEQPSNEISLSSVALLGTVAIGALIIVPRIIDLK